MKRKRNLKKKVRKLVHLTIILIISLVTIIFGSKILLSKESTFPQNHPKLDVMKELLSYNLGEKINEKFLQWVKKQYGEKTLNELYEYLKNDAYQEKIWHNITNYSLKVLMDQYNKIYENKSNVQEIQTSGKDITLSFVGDISLADNWYIIPKYEEQNKKVYGILSEDVVNIMKKSDIMVANNEFTVSNRGEKMPGKYYTFRAKPERLKIYEEMGVDLVTLANNHVYDFGKTAFYDMLDSLEEYKIPYVGAGRNIEEAKRPYYFIANGYKIAFVNATRAEKLILTPEATETEGGVLRCYDPTTFIKVIEEAKKQSDYVIALVHFGKEDSTELEKVQVDTSKQYIDAGADIIIGSHAHILQGIDFYKEKAIIYNLGDFIFNHETKDTAIFQLKITNDGEFQYKMIPCHQKDEYTKKLDGDESQRVLNKLQNLSPNIIINSDGTFLQK